MKLLIFLLPILIYYFSIRFFFDNLLAPRPLKPIQRGMMLIYVILANSLCLVYTALTQRPFEIFILNFAITFLLALFLYKVKIKQIILLCFIYSLLGLFTERLVFLFLLGSRDISVDDHFLVRLTVDIVLLIFTKIWHSYFKNRNLTMKTDGYAILLIFLPLLSILILHYLIALDSNVLTLRSLMECFFIFGLNLFVFLLFDRMQEGQVITNENSLYIQQLQYYEKYNVQLEKHQLEVEMKNHDFKNHLISISSYLSSGQYPELQNYLDSILITAPTPVITGCITIDALLYYYQEKFTAANITWELEAVIPSQLPFENSDISIILGNLLQNAYDELITISTTHLKSDISIILGNLLQNAYDELITISTTHLKTGALYLRFDRNKLMIVIENPYETILKQNHKNQFLSTKKGQSSKNRGLGIKSIYKTLDKYPHLIEIETKNQLFIVTIILFVT